MFFMAFLCDLNLNLQGEFKNTTKTFWQNHMSKANYKGVEGGGGGSTSGRRFFSRFWPALSAQNPKTPQSTKYKVQII
jgi:hypothetical protein